MKNINTIITIGRQFGSAGREIGQKLAREYGIKCYDKELLAEAAKQSGISEDLFASHDEKPTNSLLYSIVMDTYSVGYASPAFVDMPINHKVFLAQFKAIKKIADTGPCVIVGRCADYALMDYKNVINIFIYADLSDRIRRIARIHDLSEHKAKDYIRKTDKGRASYYTYYSSKKWGDVTSYDLCINSGLVGIDGAVKIIKEYIGLKESDTKVL